MSEKIWSDQAWEDYLYWQTQDKKTIRKINALIKSIERDGVMGNLMDRYHHSVERDEIQYPSGHDRPAACSGPASLTVPARTAALISASSFLPSM